MGLFDKFLDVMRLNDDDDDEYEFTNEEYYDDVVEEKPKAQKPARKEVKPEVKEKEPVKPIAKITPITKSSKKNQGDTAVMQVCVIKPTTIEEELEIVDTLLEGRTVVINMEGLNIEIAQRIIDFTSGATYAIDGNLQKISNFIFLATPHGVDISGDIQNIMDSFTTGSSYTF